MAVAPAPAWTADVWTAEDQANFFRANPPRLATGISPSDPWVQATTDESIAEAVPRRRLNWCAVRARLLPVPRTVHARPGPLDEGPGFFRCRGGPWRPMHRVPT